MKQKLLQLKELFTKTSITAILLLVCFGNVATAQNLTYTTNWLGNSGAINSLYAQEEIHNLWVSPEGTSYTTTWWDEAQRYVGVYSSSGTIQPTLSVVPRGQEVSGNSTAVFVASGETNPAGLIRFLRSNGSQTATVAVPGAAIMGVAANDAEVFVSSLNGSIYVFNANTLAAIRNFSVGGSGRLALDGGGYLWAITGSTTLKRYSNTGVLQSQSITLPSGNIAAAVTVNTANNTLYVIDRGTDQNVKVYNNVTTTPSRTTDFGVVGGILSGSRPGIVGPLRFSFNAINNTDIPGQIFGTCGIGVDNSGNIYVLDGINSASNIEKYNTSGTLQWRLTGHSFEEGAYIDPTTDETDLYAGGHHYKMNYTASANTEIGSWYGWGANINESNAYNAAERGISFAGMSPIRITNLFGSKFIYMEGQTGGIYVYRMPANSETLVNCGITDDLTTWTRGSIQCVDATGAMWSGDNLTIIEKYPCTGVSGGVPIYNLNSPVTYPIPAPYSNTYVSVRYISETDVMYIWGQTTGKSTSRVSRYNNWSTTRTLVYTKDMISNQQNIRSLTVEGDYIFTGYFTINGTVKVWNAATGAFVMDLVSPANYNARDADNNAFCAAFKRSNGEYVVTAIDYYNNKTVVYRWTPVTSSTNTPTVTTTATSAITTTTASSGGNVTADGGAAVTSRGVCWSTSVNPTVANSKTIDGTGTGTFTSAITGLTAATLYHIRAYATNSVGTSYGSDLTFTTASGGTASLTGSVIASTASVTLSSIGTTDWKHFRNNVRKSGATQISDWTAIGGTATNYTDDLRAMSWTGGSPTPTGTNITTGKYNTGINNGFSFTVPAGNGTNTLYVYVGGWNTGGKLTAHLSNSAAADYVNTRALNSNDYDLVYTITYNAAQAGQTLTVSWVINTDGGGGTLNLQAAALVGTAALKANTNIIAAITTSSVMAEVYPNPATSYVTIDFKKNLNNEQAQVEVMDVSGRRVYASGKLSHISTMQLNTSKYAKGTYIVKIITGKETVNKKIVIE